MILFCYFVNENELQPKVFLPKSVRLQSWRIINIQHEIKYAEIEKNLSQNGQSLAQIQRESSSKYFA